MLYEIFVSGEPKLLFFTTKKFTPSIARKLVGDNESPISIKPRPFQYDGESMFILDNVNAGTIAAVMQAYIKKEVERASNDNKE